MKKLIILLSFVSLFSFNSTVFAQDVLNSENFETLSLGTWSEFSVTGTQTWFASSYNGANFAKISGYSGGVNNINEDWLISPKIDFTANAPVKFSFTSARASYAGNDLEVYVSTNYDGASSPATATWTKYSATLGTSYTFVSSGIIDLSSLTGKGYIAIKYTSTSTAARTWEVDDISITGTAGSVEPLPTNYSDTITVMQYNLLGFTSGYYISCDQTNNNVTSKIGYIKTIAQYVKPDIFTVNEISNNSSDHLKLLNGCLNVDGISEYKNAGFTNSASSTIVNDLFYHSTKFTLIDKTSITGGTRDFDVYNLKFNKKDDNGNQINLTCIVAHLKAGYDATALTDRATETAKIVTYLASLSSVGNILLMGDFNLGSSTETSYQNLINPTNTALKLNDPINITGEWWWSSMAKYQTQSTHTVDNGCASTGGMNSRFDFVLASTNVINGSQKVKYIANSYKALGQDGLRYKLELNTTNNTTVPQAVATALYNSSDHLPVVLKLKMTSGTSGINEVIAQNNGIFLNFINPSSNNLDLQIENFKNNTREISVEIYSIVGQQIIAHNYELNRGLNEFSLNLKNAKSGIYIVKMTDENNNSQTKKLYIK